MCFFQNKITIWVSNIEEHKIAAFPVLNLFVQEETDSDLSGVKQ